MRSTRTLFTPLIQTEHLTAYDRGVAGRRQRPFISYPSRDWRKLQKTGSGGGITKKDRGDGQFPLGDDPLGVTLLRLWSWL